MITRNELEKLIFPYRQKDVIIFGTDRVMKLIKNGKIEKVIIANNAPEKTRKDLEYYSKLSGFEVIEVDLNNMELGTFFRKQYGISVVGIIKS